MTTIDRVGRFIIILLHWLVVNFSKSAHIHISIISCLVILIVNGIVLANRSYNDLNENELDILVIYGDNNPVFVEGQTIYSDKILKSKNNDLLVKLVNAPNSIITNSIFEEVGLEIINSPNTIIADNIIRNIDIPGQSFGIKIVNSDGTMITHNEIINISGNSKLNGLIATPFAIIVEETNNIKIEHNRIANITSNFLSSAGIGMFDSVKMNIVNNSLSNIHSSNGDSWGIGISNSEEIIFKNNTIRGIKSTLSGSSGFATGLTVSSSSNITISSNLFDTITGTASSFGLILTFDTHSPIEVIDNKFYRVLFAVDFDGDTPNCRDNTFEDVQFQGCNPPEITRTWKGNLNNLSFVFGVLILVATVKYKIKIKTSIE